jgi:hypothetical protein
MLHAVTVRSVKVRERDDDRRCWRLRGIGFAWYCSCEKRGPIMRSHRDARAAAFAHRDALAESHTTDTRTRRRAVPSARP